MDLLLIKASEMLVARRISECFGLPWSALVCYSLPWSAIVCLGCRMQDAGWCRQTYRPERPKGAKDEVKRL